MSESAREQRKCTKSVVYLHSLLIFDVHKHSCMTLNARTVAQFSLYLNRMQPPNRMPKPITA